MSAMPVAAPFAAIGVAAVSQMEANRIFQRTSRNDGTNGLGQAMVPVSITVTGGVVQYTEYQLRNVSGGAVLQAWTPLSGVVAPGTQTLYAQVPAFLGWYYIDIRVNGSTVTTGTAQFAVGEVVVIAGQSLAVCMVSTYITSDATTIVAAGTSVSPYASALAYWANNSGSYPQPTDGGAQNYPPAWQAPADSTPVNSAFAAEFTRLMIGAWKVPVGIVSYTVGGTGIATWLPGYTAPGSPHWGNLVALLTRAGGAFGAVLWCQGHYETKDYNNQQNYTAQLTQLFSALGQAFPAAASLSFKKIISTIPAIGSYGNGPVSCNNVRLWARAYVATDANARYVDGLDLTLWTDSIHYGQAGAVGFARHHYRALANAQGLLPYSDQGPIISSATRAYGSAVINLSITHPNSWFTSSGTSSSVALVLNGAVANQFVCYPAGALAGAYTISTVTSANASSIAITLAAAPTEPAAIDVYYRLPPDTNTITAAGIYDNACFGSGLTIEADALTVGRQLQMAPAAVSIAAPALAFLVNTVSNTTAGTAIIVGGTYSGTAPTSLDVTVDGGAHWTTLISPTITGGTFGFTLPTGLPALSGGNSPSQGSGLAAGAYQIGVRNTNLTSVNGVSNLFTVAPSSTYTLASNPGSLVFSWDASNPALSWQDTALSIPVVNGATVLGISDASGGGNTFTQPAPASAPVYQTNAKNGLPGLRFTGAASQFMQLAAGTSLLAALQQSSATGYFAQIVFTPATLPSSGQVASDVIVAMSHAANGAVRLAEFRNTGSTYHARVDTSNTNTSCIVASGAAANTLCDMISRYDAGQVLHNSTNALTETTQAYVSTALSLNSVYLGADFIYGTGTIYPLDGWIHEIRIYAVIGTTQNETDARTYGTSKWGA